MACASSISLEPAGPGRMRLTEAVNVVVTDAYGIDHKVSIPQGFSFDGASIPRPVWSFIGHPFDSAFALAACVHDWYCDISALTGDYQTRVIGDAVFFALLARAGVPAWKRSLMYVAVRTYSFFKG